MTRCISFNILWLIFLGMVNGAEVDESTIDFIQNYNIKTLKTALPQGWRSFCEADVDEGVISFFPGSNPSDATIHLVTPNNETISLPIKYVSKIREFGLNPQQKTVIYVNAFPSDHIYDVRGNLQYMQEARRDYNIIVVDFAQDILQLYNAIKHNVFVEGYFIAKLISTLVTQGVKQEDITLIGHSVGANIAALGAKLHSEEEAGKKVSTLIALDPALMCHHEDVHVNADAAEKVIVIHGENEIFSIAEPVGTIDIFPNGHGIKYQPGCNSKMCSHVFPFLLFLDAVIERTPIRAVRCESWSSFRRGKCEYSTVVSLGLDFTNAISGEYYCVTRGSQPYGLKEDGLQYKKRQARRSRIEPKGPKRL